MTSTLRHLVLLHAACLTLPTLYGQIGQVVALSMRSEALEGNLLNDSPEREILVYLPPDYEANRDRRYPVVYSLHGNSAGGQIELKSYYGSPLPEIMDPLIAQKKIGEMIIVQPNSINRYGGSHYANSTVSGNWGDFIVHELVAYIDRNYRTLAKPDSRGLTGHSMGARGALCLSLQYPGIFGVVYATSGRMAFHATEIDDEASWRTILSSPSPPLSERGIRRVLGHSVAFSPNPRKPPYFADFPITFIGNSLAVDEAVMKRWAAFDPVQLVEQNANPLRGLRALHFDCGTSDQPLIDTNRLFSTILVKHNIPHVFEEYDGGHNDKRNERFKTKVLPMLSKHLVFE